jgi:hypothetical protein
VRGAPWVSFQVTFDVAFFVPFRSLLSSIYVWDRPLSAIRDLKPHVSLQ